MIAGMNARLGHLRRSARTVDDGARDRDGEQHRRGMRRPRRPARTVLFVVLLALLAVAGFEVGTGRFHVTPVLSGSMRPGLQPGDVVVTKRVPVSSLAVRDVVVFRVPDTGQLRVHRIVALQPGREGRVTITTRGDANRADDPERTVLAGATAYRVVRVIPMLGYPAVWLHDGHQGVLIALLGIGVVAAALGSLRRARTSPSDDPDPAATDKPVDETSAPSVAGEAESGIASTTAVRSDGTERADIGIEDLLSDGAARTDAVESRDDVGVRRLTLVDGS